MAFNCFFYKFNLFQILIFAVLLAPDHVNADHSTDHIPAAVERILKKYKIPKNSLSFYIREYNSSTPLLSLNLDTPRNPASAIKLLTSYAGLEILGPNYTWETHIHLDGKLSNGTLNGDLIIEGGGDP